MISLPLIIKSIYLKFKTHLSSPHKPTVKPFNIKKPLQFFFLFPITKPSLTPPFLNLQPKSFMEVLLKILSPVLILIIISFVMLLYPIFKLPDRDVFFIFALYLTIVFPILCIALGIEAQYLYK